MCIFKNTTGLSENSSEIIVGWSDGLYFTLLQWEKYRCGIPQKKSEKSLRGGL